MRRKLFALVVVVGMLVSALPTFLSPTPAAAADYYTFHAVEPAVQITVSHNDTWETINATTYGVPLGATGILYTARNWEGSGGDDEPFGIRKHGSTDDRTNPLWEHTPTWGAIGVDEDCLFDVYSGSATTSFGIWIIGYTTVGVTFFTDAYDITPATTGWSDVDCSTEAPSAIGVIVEVVGPSRGETMFNFGIQAKGCTSGFLYNAADHLAPGIIVGCDANQVIQIYNGGYYEFYLIGYVYDGAHFYTTPVAQGPTVAGAWTDLTTALPAGSVMGFYEWRGSGSAYTHDLRPNGSAWAFGGLDNRHCWAYAGCDGAGLVEGYVQHTSVGYWLVGYAIPGFYNVSTQDATDVDSVSATFHGTVTNNNSEEVELRGFQWGLTQTPTWEWYETGSSEFWINPSSTNYMYNAAAGYSRLGQRITMAYNVTSLSFYMLKTLNPTGDISYRIDTAAGANVWNQVLFDAGSLTGVGTWYKITLNETLELAGDYRLYTQYVGGDVANYVQHGYRAADVDDGVYTKDIGPISAWADSGTQESGIKFDYQSSAAYELGSYNYTVTGLADNTQYFYRAYMVTSGGTYYGQWVPFGTANQPVVTTLPASSVAMTAARLNSLVDADGDEPVTIRFGWGNTTQTAIEDYDHYETKSGTYVEGEHPYLDVDDLNPTMTYYFRVEGTNVNGSNLGDELSFTTVDLTAAVSNFRGIPHPSYIDLSWDTLPGASNYLIRYTYGGFTNSTTSGYLAYFDSPASARHSGLDAGTSIYYTIWGESGGYHGAPAYLLLTTTSGAAGTGTLEPLPEPTGWFAATDYEHLSGVPILYPIVNGMADMMGAPRANAWFLAAVMLAIAAGWFAWVKLHSFAGGLGVMVFFLFLGHVLVGYSLWIPIVSLVLTVLIAYLQHKEFAR